MTDPTPAPPLADPETTALIERISACLGRTGPVLTPLQALLMDARTRLRELSEANARLAQKCDDLAEAEAATRGAAFSW